MISSCDQIESAKAIHSRCGKMNEPRPLYGAFLLSLEWQQPPRLATCVCCQRRPRSSLRTWLRAQRSRRSDEFSFQNGRSGSSEPSTGRPSSDGGGSSPGPVRRRLLGRSAAVTAPSRPMTCSKAARARGWLVSSAPTSSHVTSTVSHIVRAAEMTISSVSSGSRPAACARSGTMSAMPKARRCVARAASQSVPRGPTHRLSSESDTYRK